MPNSVASTFYSNYNAYVQARVHENITCINCNHKVMPGDFKTLLELQEFKRTKICRTCQEKLQGEKDERPRFTRKIS